MRLRRPKVDSFSVAEEAVKKFWGASNGGQEDLDIAKARLRDAKLKTIQIRTLRANLPVGCLGTTGQRIERIDRVLKGLEREAE